MDNELKKESGEQTANQGSELQSPSDVLQSMMPEMLLAVERASTYLESLRKYIEDRLSDDLIDDPEVAFRWLESLATGSWYDVNHAIHKIERFTAAVDPFYDHRVMPVPPEYSDWVKEFEKTLSPQKRLSTYTALPESAQKSFADDLEDIQKAKDIFMNGVETSLARLKPPHQATVYDYFITVTMLLNVRGFLGAETDAALRKHGRNLAVLNDLTKKAENNSASNVSKTQTKSALLTILSEATHMNDSYELSISGQRLTIAYWLRRNGHLGLNPSKISEAAKLLKVKTFDKGIRERCFTLMKEHNLIGHIPSGKDIRQFDVDDQVGVRLWPISPAITDMATLIEKLKSIPDLP